MTFISLMRLSSGMSVQRLKKGVLPEASLLCRCSLPVLEDLSCVFFEGIVNTV